MEAPIKTQKIDFSEVNRLVTCDFTNEEQIAFNSIMLELDKYINSLIFGIDVRQFQGLESSDIKSAFIIKALYVFQKYKDNFSDLKIIKGHIISGLGVYKHKLVSYLYRKSKLETVSWDFTIATGDKGESEIDSDLDITHQTDEYSSYVDIDDILKPFYDTLSFEARNYIEIMLDIPEYILEHPRYKPNKKRGILNRVPRPIIEEYLGYNIDPLLKEINKAISKFQRHNRRLF